MDKQVFIVHGSVIVQNGLAEIIRKSFKCTISCFLNFSDFLQSEQNGRSVTIIFVEDEQASKEEYLQFLGKSNQVIPFNIVNQHKDELQHHRPNTLFLHSSPDEIYQKIKLVFEQKWLDTAESEGLTNREVDVLKLVALGHSNKEIADKLFISIHTVMSHRKNLTEKLGIKSISGLTVYAIINNIIDTTNLNVKDLI